MKNTMINFATPPGVPEFQNPMDDVINRLSRHMAEQKDAVIRKAVNNHLGREDWTIEEVVPRLLSVYDPAFNITTVTMDEQPILTFGEMESGTEWRGDSQYFRATQGYNILNEP